MELFLAKYPPTWNNQSQYTGSLWSLTSLAKCTAMLFTPLTSCYSSWTQDPWLLLLPSYGDIQISCPRSTGEVISDLSFHLLSCQKLKHGPSKILVMWAELVLPYYWNIHISLPSIQSVVCGNLRLIFFLYFGFFLSFLWMSGKYCFISIVFLTNSKVVKVIICFYLTWWSHVTSMLSK